MKALRNAAKTWSLAQVAKNAATPTVQALRAPLAGRPARVEDLASVRAALKHGAEVRDA